METVKENEDKEILFLSSYYHSPTHPKSPFFCRRVTFGDGSAATLQSLKDGSPIVLPLYDYRGVDGFSDLRRIERSEVFQMAKNGDLGCIPVDGPIPDGWVVSDEKYR